MNKQELIDYCNAVKENKSQIINCIDVNGIIKKIEQLDEPEKIAIPQFVADWITHSKNIGRSLFGAMSILEENTEIKKWMQWADNQETFALAWIFGYEVEEEPKYIVKIPVVNQYLVRVKDEDFLGFLTSKLRTKFTRKELEEAGFGWVLDCPGIELEEVIE